MNNKIEFLKNKAREIRLNAMECVASIGMGHVGGILSVADLLAVLYFDTMNINPDNPKYEERDRLVMSKGHAGPALYAALALKGYFPAEMLKTLNKPGTKLPSHCDMNRTPGIDMTTGSLGQGLSAAVGMAISAKMDKLPSRIFAILGDGDSQEGQTWEAGMFASQMKVDNLVAFTDKNGMQIDGIVDDINALGNLNQKWSSFGWDTINVADGNDVEQILAAISAVNYNNGKPTMIILNTVKGKGVSFTEGRADSHHIPVSEEQYKIAAAELA